MSYLAKVGFQLNDLENNNDNFLLAVYGTLKENFPNYFYFLNPKKPIFKGVVHMPFQMYSDGGFPILFPVDEINKIYIEVFEVSQKTLDKIDRLEGVPELYNREIIYIEEIGYEVFLYVIRNREPFGDLIEDGLFE